MAAKEKGNELYKQKNFEEALKCYATAFELFPQDMTFLSNRAGESGLWESCCLTQAALDQLPSMR